MDFLDRVPTYPNRKKITYEDGSVEYAKIEYADEPIEEGTPLNKATFETLQTVVGDYIGNDDSNYGAGGFQTVDLGFTPKAVVVTSPKKLTNATDNITSPQIGIATKSVSFSSLMGDNYASGIEIVSGGFKVSNGYNYSNFYAFNRQGVSYSFIAFKD